ncbi:NADH-ubiquinone/plastoquinone oxidoreductase, chain 3 [Bacteriovorax sp. BAL6_X]|uniref:NADH-quinone oxidoreductase subunit A n=1 Tax=Bacteriovorax sp. BAL6_X TaxID=1201290 RepID=UPI0003855921|nr:NADH-quinone oxidoreductase subunit A [Bacteriovorax sp. BAL6_X]EPZ50251.1 NADH-ubiquinone/plastoquinone oxidoreductase, chain 3 [Bacteriovorax sp. BAL6_X]
MSQNFDVYMPVLILAAVAVVAFFGTLLVGRLVRPNNPTELKLTPYECGEEPTGSAWSNFNVRFYVIALVFLIFDVEGALMFPVATVYKNFVDIGQGGAVLGSLLLFIVILSLGLVYCWKKGDLDWVKSFQANINGKDK